MIASLRTTNIFYRNIIYRHTRKPSKAFSPNPPPTSPPNDSDTHESSLIDWKTSASPSGEESQLTTLLTPKTSISSTEVNPPTISIRHSASSELPIDFSKLSHQEMNSLLTKNQGKELHSAPLQKRKDLLERPSFAREEETPKKLLQNLKELYPQEPIGINPLANTSSATINLKEVEIIEVHEGLVTAIDTLWENVYTKRDNSIDNIGKNELDIKKIRLCAQAFTKAYISNPSACFMPERIKNCTDQFPSKSAVSLYLVHIGTHLELPKGELDDLVTLGVMYDLGKALIEKTLWEKKALFLK